ncbi:MAG: 3,4-dihydroxy-2-butanone-4-phosphate synthase [Armatimonadetes bacterium]|nr:3,4-dihydroxy-2-butanone-4-phosphate synthase [Armatimonadota bacterium]
MNSTTFATVEAVVDQLRAGGLAIVTDSEDRENEGDLILAASHATPDTVNFLAREGRGLICAPVSAERAAALDLPLMTARNSSPYRTAFTISVEAIEGVATGISAQDRAKTLRALADPATHPEDLARPGHIFPLIAQPHGVLQRQGHTEAVVDLMRLAGLPPVGALCEVLSADGSMARMPELIDRARAWGIPILTIDALIRHRLRHESFVRVAAETQLPANGVAWRVLGFEYIVTGDTHLALVLGDLDQGGAPLTRLHSECLTGDVFGSHRCDCGPQLQGAMNRIAREGRGAIVYVREEGRGIGLLNKIRAYQLQDHGLDTVDANLHLGLPADARDHRVGTQILKAIGIRRTRLMTNNPAKVTAVEEQGIEVVERVGLSAQVTPENKRYLAAKRNRLNHLLEI